MQTVPCGNCLGCRAEQGRQWAVRMMHESEMWPQGHAWFVTLTYDDKHLPDNGSLVTEDLRDFHQSVRSSIGKCSFYGVGEYGDQFSRPHYHTVLYGPQFEDRFPVPDRDGAPVWVSQTLDSYWKHRGKAEFSAVTMGSASYVAAYVRKKLTARENPDLYSRVDPFTGELFQVLPEFASMSRRPAIGKRWIQKNWRDVYAHDSVVVDGIEAKPPRYYDKWMSQDHSEMQDNTCRSGECKEHRELMLEVQYNRWDPDFDDSAYKRSAREAIHKARIGLFQERTVF